MTHTEALQLLVDAMRRADPAYCAAHQVEQITDAEWDAALEAAEDALDVSDAREGIEAWWLILPVVIGGLLFCAYAYVSSTATASSAENARIAAECKR